jgi:maltose alpha-D-glucosyltransferase/alpha-amylase
VLLDLVVNHTSDQLPWFQSACADPRSPFRDWYVWSEDEPPDRRQGMVFPGEQTETWTWNEQAQAWYYHRFYDFQPDLNWRTRGYARRSARSWLLAAARRVGFRIDAAPFVLELVRAGVDPAPLDFSILDGWRQDAQWRDGTSVLLLEANVDVDRVTS